MKHFFQQLSHGTRSAPWLSGMLAILTGALYLFGGPAPSSLVYNRAAIDAGEYWRLISGHLVHCDVNHLLLNGLAFILLALLIEKQSTKLIPSLITGIVSVNFYLWIVEVELILYCGLSGILNTLLVVALVDLYIKTKNLLFPLTLAGAFLKICWEITTSKALFSSTLWQSVPATHAAGFAGGILLLIIYYLILKSNRSSPLRLHKIGIRSDNFTKSSTLPDNCERVKDRDTQEQG